MNFHKLLNKNIKFEDILGEHSGVINEVRIKENGTFIYVLSFGQNNWFDIKDMNIKWRLY